MRKIKGLWLLVLMIIIVNGCILTVESPERIYPQEGLHICSKHSDLKVYYTKLKTTTLENNIIRENWLASYNADDTRSVDVMVDNIGKVTVHFPLKDTEEASMLSAGLTDNIYSWKKISNIIESLSLTGSMDIGSQRLGVSRKFVIIYKEE